MRTYPSHTPPNKICKGGGLVRTTLPSLDRLAEAEAGRRGRTWDKWVGADHDDDDVMMSVQVGADHDDVMMSVLDKWVGADLHRRSLCFWKRRAYHLLCTIGLLKREGEDQERGAGTLLFP